MTLQTPNTERPNAPRSWTQWLRWVLVEDHCEWANQYVALLRTPLGILSMGAVASLLCGVYVAPQGYALFAAIVTVIVLGLVWPSVAMRGIRGRLVFESRRGREGKPAATKLLVTNRWPWPVWGLAIEEPMLADPDQSETVVALARVEGWSRATFNCAFTPSLRGEYPRTEVRIGSGFPFGLYRSSRPVEVAKRLIVWPETFWLPTLADPSHRRDWRGDQSDAYAGSQGTRLGPREHRHGDTLRDVHWAKSARYDRLIVSERESAAVEEVTVVVDVDPTRHSGEGRGSTLEWSLRIAASICEAVAGQRGAVTLRLGGREYSATGAGGELGRLLDEIALFDPTDAAERGLASPSASGGPRESTIYIGPERSIRPAGRFICVRPPGRRNRSDASAWIVVDTGEDVAGQVLGGWCKRSRRSVRAV